MINNKHLANREWAKDLKFNGHWYHLLALFDMDQNPNDDVYDFNNALNNTNNIEGSLIESPNVIEAPLDNITDFNSLILSNDVINKWQFKPVGNTYDEDTQFVIEFVQTSINNINNVIIEFNILYRINGKNTKNKPFPGSRISINKNIIGHSIEDLIIWELKRNAKGKGIQIWHNTKKEQIDTDQYVNGSEILANSLTCDVKIGYKNKIYYFEIKSGEYTRKKEIEQNVKNIMASLLKDNIRIGDVQWDNKNNMFFILSNYKLMNPLKSNDVLINNIILVDGADIIPKKP